MLLDREYFEYEDDDLEDWGLEEPSYLFDCTDLDEDEWDIEDESVWNYILFGSTE